MSPDVDNARTGQRNSTDPPRQIHKSSILTWIFLERGFLYSTSNCKNKPSDVESSSVLPHAHSFLQAEGPQCPFGLVFAPCCRAEGLSWGFATPGVAPGGALDSTEELWHPSPKQSEGRQYAPQLARPLRRPAARADVTEEASPVCLDQGVNRQ